MASGKGVALSKGVLHFRSKRGGKEEDEVDRQFDRSGTREAGLIDT